MDGSTAPPYPFGHGLSYTTWAYQDLEVASGSTVDDLNRRFATQSLVDAEVQALSETALVELVEACSRWRANGVAERIRGRRSRIACAAVGDVYRGPAEGSRDPAVR